MMEALSMRALCQVGIRRGRLSGSAKKAKIASIGWGSHCSAW
jgi:hypothetical protein